MISLPTGAETNVTSFVILILLYMAMARCESAWRIFRPRIARSAKLYRHRRLLAGHHLSGLQASDRVGFVVAGVLSVFFALVISVPFSR